MKKPNIFMWGLVLFMLLFTGTIWYCTAKVFEYHLQTQSWDSSFHLLEFALAFFASGSITAWLAVIAWRDTFPAKDR